MTTRDAARKPKTRRPRQGRSWHRKMLRSKALSRQALRHRAEEPFSFVLCSCQSLAGTAWLYLSNFRSGASTPVPAGYASSVFAKSRTTANPLQSSSRDRTLSPARRTPVPTLRGARRALWASRASHVSQTSLEFNGWPCAIRLRMSLSERPLDRSSNAQRSLVSTLLSGLRPVDVGGPARI
jgi:hypothetical protein